MRIAAILLVYLVACLPKPEVHVLNSARKVHPCGAFGRIALAMGLLAFTISMPSYAATGVVGSGTPASCTGTALSTLIATVPIGGVITFNCGGIATVAMTAQVVITANTTINGAGLITLNGGNTTRHFAINSGATLNLNGITLTGGYIGSGEAGGAVSVGSGATLTAANATFSSNEADNGGAIQNNGTTSLTNVTVGGNVATYNGGGISNSGTLTLTNVTIGGNRATGQFGSRNGGGGIDNNGAATLLNVSMIGNKVEIGTGGAIRNYGSVTATNSTLASNSVTAIYGYTGGGVSGSIGVTFRNSILASNTGGNCDSGMYQGSLGFNISDDGSCGGFDQTGDHINTSAKLGSPANNGGPNTDATGGMQTILPQASSPAIDAIPNGTNGCGTTYITDQRGQPRPANGGVHATYCDIGAVEAQPSSPATGTVTVYKSVSGTTAVPGTIKYAVSLTCGATVLGPQNVVAGGATVFGNIPAGSCTLSENTAALPKLAGVQWGTPTYSPSATISVIGGLNTNTGVSNIANAVGTVIVSKVVAGNAASAVPSNVTYSVQLTCGATSLGAQTIYNGQSATFTNVPTGSCTVSEDAPGVTSGALWSWSAPAFSPSATIIVSKGATTNVVVTNIAKFPANTVYVNKVVTGPAVMNVYPPTQQYPITLTCGGNTPVVANATRFSQATFANVPNGTCVLSETLPAITGVKWSAPSFSPSATFNMTAGDAVTVTATNTANFAPNTVSVFLPIYGEASFPPGTPRPIFPITLTCGTWVRNANVGVYLPYVFTDVPSGSCNLSQGTPPTISGVVWGAPTFNPAKTFTVNASVGVYTEIIETANTTVLTTGTVLVDKNVSGTAASSVAAATSFPISLTCGSTHGLNSSVTMSTEATFAALPVGTCTLAEGTLPSITGVAWGVPTFTPSSTVSVVAGGTTRVSITNTASTTGNNLVRLMHLGTPVNTYATLQDAYAAAVDGDVIQARAEVLPVEYVTFASASNKTVALDGGYDSGFTSITGITTLSGSLTIGRGTMLTIENLLIK